MSRKALSLLALFIIIAFASCMEKSISYDPKTMFDPLKKGDKPEFTIAEGVSEQSNPFVENKQVVSILKKYVPIYQNPFFNTTGMPSLQGEGPNKDHTTISGDTFHNASPMQVYTWIVDHLADAGLRLATKDELGGTQDPLVYIDAEGTGYIWAISDGLTFNISIFNLRAYPGWVKVGYEGTRKLPYIQN